MKYGKHSAPKGGGGSAGKKSGAKTGGTSKQPATQKGRVGQRNWSGGKGSHKPAY